MGDKGGYKSLREDLGSHKRAIGLLVGLSLFVCSAAYNIFGGPSPEGKYVRSLALKGEIKNDVRNENYVDASERLAELRILNVILDRNRYFEELKKHEIKSLVVVGAGGLLMVGSVVLPRRRRIDSANSGLTEVID